MAALVSAGGELDVGAGAVGIVFTAFFSLCTASYLWRLLSGRPVLVLDERGIGNATSIGGTKHLPWADMTSSARSARSRRRTWT